VVERAQPTFLESLLGVDDLLLVILVILLLFLLLLGLSLLGGLLGGVLSSVLRRLGGGLLGGILGLGLGLLLLLYPRQRHCSMHTFPFVARYVNTTGLGVQLRTA
jgi:hypothetical protein